MFTNDKDLRTELNEVINDFSEAISRFSPQAFNQIPFTGSWTAGQVADHMFLAIKDVPDILLDQTMKADRKPDENVPAIKSVFLDFQAKYQSPEFVLPGNGLHDVATYIKGFDEVRQKLIAAVDLLDLSEICTTFPFPQMGNLTRLEWICVSLCHMYRHTKQMHDIHGALYKEA